MGKLGPPKENGIKSKFKVNPHPNVYLVKINVKSIAYAKPTHQINAELSSREEEKNGQSRHSARKFS